MKPLTNLTAIFTLIFWDITWTASGQDDYANELEKNFKNVLGQLSVMSGNTDPSLLLEGGGEGKKYGIKLIIRFKVNAT